MLAIYYVRYENFDDSWQEGPLFYETPRVDNPRITIGVIGGIHGNERSGSVALANLIASGWFDAQKSIAWKVIPNANPYGLLSGSRYDDKGKDLNRQFVDGVMLDDTIPSSVLTFFADCDLVIDLHEGWGWHQISPASMGSTITANSGWSSEIAMGLLDAVNRVTYQIYPFEPKKQFVMLDYKTVPCEIPSTLGCYLQKMGKDHILIEITGQRNIQPMRYRLQQIYSMMDKLVDMVNSGRPFSDR